MGLPRRLFILEFDIGQEADISCNASCIVRQSWGVLPDHFYKLKVRQCFLFTFTSLRKSLALDLIGTKLRKKEAEWRKERDKGGLACRERASQKANPGPESA